MIAMGARPADASRIHGIALPRESGGPITKSGNRVTTRAFARPGAVFRVVFALLALLVLGSCGSGGVSGPVPVNDPTRITILPDNAILYSGLPTTFTISGGTGSYIVSSSNQSVVPVSGTLDRPTLTVVPANVTLDTAVTLTVRDTGTAPLATASLTVRPGTVANDITVIPSSTQGGSCAPAVCSGGDAVVTATISQGGNPLPARGVRLDVVSGDFRFITSPPNVPEVLETSTTVVSDQNGAVHARIRVLPGAANQSAIVQVTDLGTNAFRRAVFQVAQATGASPGFFTVPSEVTFTGPNNLSCATGARQDVSIFGGTPPYTIGNGGSAFSVSTNFVGQSGGAFYIVANGPCASNIPIPVTDSAGRSASVTTSNVRGENAVPALVVAPSTVTLSDCLSQVSATVAGGIPGSFTVSSTSGAITVNSNPSSRIITIQRAVTNTAPSSPINVGVASGDKVANITVNLTGEALTSRCEGSNMTVTPSSATLAGCGFAQSVVSGGTAPYSVVSNSSAVTASVAGNLVRIDRVNPSPVQQDPATVTVFDSSPTVPRVSRSISVTVTGNCP